MARWVSRLEYSSRGFCACDCLAGCSITPQKQHARTPERDKILSFAYHALQPDVGPTVSCSRHGVREKVKWHIAWRTTVVSTMPALLDCLPAPTASLHARFLRVTRTVEIFAGTGENSPPLHEEHARLPTGLASLDTLICRDVCPVSYPKALPGDLSRRALDVATDIRRLRGDVWCRDTGGSLKEVEPVLATSFGWPPGKVEGAREGIRRVEIADASEAQPFWIHQVTRRLWSVRGN